MNVRWITVLGLIGLAWAASADVFNDGNVNLRAHRLVAADCPEGLAAFTSTVHTKIRKDCKRCHDSGGPGPAFAVADASDSYFRVLNYSEFADPSTSTLGVRAGNGHCGLSNCNADSGTELVALMRQWWDSGEKSCSRFGKVFTVEQEIPALPAVGAFQELRFDLSTLGSDYEDLVFSIEAQQFTSPTETEAGAYRFRKPRIMGPGPALHVEGVRVLINRKWDIVANEYLPIRQIGSVTPPPAVDMDPIYPLLSTEHMIVIQDQKAGDRISISFEGFGTAAARGCKNPEGFKASVLPYLQNAKCTTCHGAADATLGKMASRSLNLEIGDVCQTSLERVRWDRPNFSALFELPVRGKHGHPVVIPNADRYWADLNSWIRLER